jgi:hypothetical protein
MTQLKTTVCATKKESCFRIVQILQVWQQFSDQERQRRVIEFKPKENYNPK